MFTSRVPASWVRPGLLALFVLFVYTLLPSHSKPAARVKLTKKCPGFIDNQKIVVSVKTGATEAQRKIPTQMRTSLGCIENVIIFSDLEQKLDGYHIHDALDTVVDYTVNDNPDFQFYNQQKELWKTQKNLSTLEGARSPVNPDDLAAWRLDKYKFIHVLEKTWKMKPDMDWYFIIDADTYILWSNMIPWLRTMDSEKKSYLGSQVEKDGTRFAHGGSGIILSKAAVKELVVEHQDTAARWDDVIYDTCCGDLLLARALSERNIVLQDVWPLMSGESPFTLPFGAATPEYWCRPALSLHHLRPDDMREVAAFERHRGKSSQPVTHAEIFNTLLLTSFPAEKSNWDNLASDVGEFGKTGGVHSKTPFFEKCKTACQKDPKCIQYSHHDEDCYLGMSVRRGYHKDSDSRGPWISGWNRTKLEDWVSKQTECGPITFPEQNGQ